MGEQLVNAGNHINILYCTYKHRFILGEMLTVNPGKHISWMLVLPSMAVISVWGNSTGNVFEGTHSLGEHISL